MKIPTFKFLPIISRLFATSKSQTLVSQTSRNTHNRPSSPPIPTIYKDISVLTCVNAILLILVGIDLTSIIMCQYLLCDYGVSIFDTFYLYHWFTIAAILLVIFSCIIRWGKILAVIPYLIITVIRLLWAFNLVSTFTQNPDKILIDLKIRYNNPNISGAIGFFVMNNLIIIVAHCYFAFTTFCYFMEEIILDYFDNNNKRGKNGNNQISFV